jgi:hypothetical protein
MPFPVVLLQSWLGNELTNRVARLTDIQRHNEDLLSWLDRACGYRRTSSDPIAREQRLKLRVELEALSILAFKISEAEFRHMCRDFPSAIGALGGNAFINSVLNNVSDFAAAMNANRVIGTDPHSQAEVQEDVWAA